MKRTGVLAGKIFVELLKETNQGVTKAFFSPVLISQHVS